MTDDGALAPPAGRPATAYLGLGANIGDAAIAVAEAMKRLGAVSGIEIDAVSSLYRTAPVGVTDQPDFFNAVVRVATTLGPAGLLVEALGIERSMGRERTVRWGPRVIDIDVLLYDDRSLSIPGLTLPHPRMYERAFVLAPLAEIAPDLFAPATAVLPAETVLARALRLSEGTRVERACPPPA
ncbi:MAG: 2-amino-4-hydroxy-6-hydroxymethyldihydropteridine diphosphokinase [Capsulimonadaceae bacterium]